MGAGLGLLGLGSVAIGIGIVFGCLSIALAVTPWMEQKLLGVGFLGFALCEIMGLIILLFTLVILFI
jgi:F0F1-type ATP synthase membrane subunit c/vacuolar-type H+-ATPase subunit K